MVQVPATTTPSPGEDDRVRSDLPPAEADPVARALLDRRLPTALLARARLLQEVTEVSPVDALLEVGAVDEQAFREAVRAAFGREAFLPRTLRTIGPEAADWLPLEVAADGPVVPVTGGPSPWAASARPTAGLEARLRAASGRHVHLAYGPPSALAAAFGRVYRVLPPGAPYRDAGRRRLDPDGFVTSASGPAAVSPAPVPAAAALERSLLTARSSRAVLDQVLAHLCTTWEAAAFFLAEGDLLVGRAAAGDPRLARLVLPIHGPTLFARVVSTRHPFEGPPPAHLVDEAVHVRLGRPVPAEVLLVPLVEEGVVLGLLYADRRRPSAAPSAGIPPERLGRMTLGALSDLYGRSGRN